MSYKKKVLMLGGEGFIGRNIADALSSKYDCHSLGVEKSIFDKRGRKDKFLKADPYKKKIRNGYNIIIHLIDNNKSIKEFAKGERELIKNINLNNQNHLIVFSSAVVYANPDSDYGKRKLKLEKIYKGYCRKNNIQLTIFRLHNTFGRYQLPHRQGSLIANIFYNYLNKKKIVINDMSVARDFIFAGDIGKFVKYAIDKPYIGIGDLATGRHTTLRKIIKIIEKEVIKDNLPLIDKGIKEKIFDHKAKNILPGKVSLTPLKKALQKTFKFYKKNNERI